MLIALAASSIVIGIQPIIGTATTWVPLLAVPAAAGLPFLIPPLRAVPLGETSWAFWAADLTGAAVMLVTAFVLLRAADRRRPHPGAARAFGRSVGVATLSVVAGNVVRGVFSSFAVHADLGTYLGSLVANVLVSALVGALVGLVIGAVAAIVAAVGRRAGHDEAHGRSTDAAAGEPVRGAAAP